MSGSHHSPFVILSILMAIGASYTALTLAGRVTVARGRTRVIWLLGGSIAMGSGIWSMHFIAMLAFHLPVSIAYDIPLVAASHLAAVGASAFALFVASRVRVGRLQILAAGLCLGLAIVGMHYTGMAAVRVPAHLHYDPLLVGASVLVAVTASTVALVLFLWLRTADNRRGVILRVGASVLMGFAIAGMHYTAMAAAHFTAPGTMPAPSGLLIDSSGLALPVVFGAFVILSLALIGAITDHWVRARLATAEALRESEERYRSVVSDIDEVIFRTDAEGRWTFLNPAWRQITGYAPEESLGTRVVDIIHPEDLPGCIERCQPLMAGLEDFLSYELRYVDRTGEAQWVEVHARAMRSPTGQMVGTAGVIRDVSERRKVEEALRAASEAAEAASRAKSEFLSRMSHELRTPLNAIIGFGQLIEIEAETVEQRESAEQILRAGRHLLVLINEVLDITGIEAGRLHVSVEPVEVRDVVQEIVELVAPLTSEHGIVLRAEIPALPARFVRADRQRIKQVLLNLIANAVKYNRPGGRVTVSCAIEPSGRTRISVEDDGPGLSPEKAARLFTPFDRLGADQTGVEGTGLGLALSRRLMDVMDGEMGVRTEVGNGSTFWAELPTAESPLDRLDLAAVPARTPGSGEGRRSRILYVEDNLSNLTLVKRILARRPDIELIPAMQGGLAIELARTSRPDLILLDLHLPDIPGEEVLAQIRQDQELRRIPVVVLSADATESMINRLTLAGAHAYVTKPLDVKPFVEMLDNILDARAAA